MKKRETITQGKEKIGFGYLAVAILLAVCGTVMLVFPEESAMWAVRVLGIATLLVYGIRSVLDIASFKKDGRTVKRAMAVVCDVLALVCGGFFVIFPEGVLTYLFMAAGLYLIIDGSFKLQTTINLRRYRKIITWVLLLFAATDIALGFLLIKFPQDSLQANMIILGIALLSDAAAQLISLFAVTAVERCYKEEQRRALAAEWEEKAAAEKEKQTQKRGLFGKWHSRQEEKKQSDLANKEDNA